MNTVYTTVISDEHLVMGLSLAVALNNFNKKVSIYCIDENAANNLKKLKFSNLNIYSPEDFQDVKLKSLKKTRSVAEFCWTCKSYALEHALMHDHSLDWAIYLDSDMMIFGDPDQALPENEDVLLTPHNFSSGFKSFENHVGLFNAGYIGIKNSNNGLKALSWWKKKCLEKCSSIPENGLYADQAYLNKMTKKYSFVNTYINEGLNAGPWNIFDKNIKEESGTIRVDNQSLLIYHMQGLKLYDFGIVNFYDGGIKIPTQVKDLIYKPYLRHLHKTSSMLDNGFLNLIFQRLTLYNFLIELKRMLFGRSNIYFSNNLRT